MCGIIGLLLANPDAHVNQLLFDGLTVLQHRGQDAAGIVTAERRRLHLRKDNGLVKDVFQAHHMLELRGNLGLGHVRYPTAGSSSCAEAQPLYTNYPYGVCVAHNGNITNTDELTIKAHSMDRHVNTDSDSELILNLFAEALTKQVRGKKDIETTDERQEAIFAAMQIVMEQCHGGYAGLYLINGFGLVGFRDPHGIRPLVFGCRQSPDACSGADDEPTSTTSSSLPGTPAAMEDASNSLDYVIASESVAIDTLGFKLVRYVCVFVVVVCWLFWITYYSRETRQAGRACLHTICLVPLSISHPYGFSASPVLFFSVSDVRAGEAIFIDMEGNCHSRMVHPKPDLSPCIFEYVYFARPDSIMDGISVYETRLRMGEKLADKILRVYPNHEIDVVIPIPDTSRTSALQAAYKLNRPFREGFIKNRYIARTFIMPGQAIRRKSVRLKLNTIKSEFAGKNVLLVDDSIVRGTTANEIVQMARDAGAKKVFFSSAAPPIRYPNIYGIDIPTRQELIAYERDEDEIAEKIGCDWVVYQDLKDLEDSIKESAPKDLRHPVKKFDSSCFSGCYVTGEKIGDDYFTKLHAMRNDDALEKRKRGPETDDDDSSGKRPVQSNNGCETLSNNKTEITS